MAQEVMDVPQEVVLSFITAISMAVANHIAQYKDHLEMMSKGGAVRKDRCVRKMEAATHRVCLIFQRNLSHKRIQILTKVTLIFL